MEKMKIEKPMEMPKGEIVPKQDNYLVMQGDPEKQLEFATKASRALVQVIQQKPKKVMINGEQYLEFEDWQTLGRFYGITVGIEWTKPVEREGKIFGYEARAVVYRNSEVISSAEAMCLRSEKNWTNRDEFALRSMAQTRASAKALRNVLAWVAVLAGFRGTPVEEMPSDVNIEYVPTADKTRSSLKKPNGSGILYEPPATTPTPNWKRNAVPYSSKGMVCVSCNVVCDNAVQKYSKDFYGMILCRDCQNRHPKIN